ncbi:MAG: ATP-binding cassette domain-containing protein [Candidatus Promineifilaceae bacterium]|nr:ATP-binding cassette domain-containing protein [Candidatus Promineifilaceae bacterium]
MIDVEALAVRYGDVPALSGLDLQIPGGQFVLVTGPSGCGKSTLVRALTGLIPHALPATMTGRVTVNGLNTREQPLSTLARHAAIVLQNPAAQLFHLNVADEVAFGPRNLGLPEQEVQERAAWALAAVGIDDLRARRPSTLSGGEQQRVAIAAVLAMQPTILILDEPTASLDSQGTDKVLATLKRLNRQLDMTVVLVEHRLAAAMSLAHRLLILDEGVLVADGAPQDLLQNRNLREAFGLRRPGTPSSTSWETLLTSNGAPSGDSPLLLQMEGVTAGYRGNPVLHDVNLSLRRGEFVAVVGENGAGKSTLGRVAAGLLKPAGGEVRFQGNRRPRPGRDVALLFQNPADQIFTDSVGEEVAFGPRNYRVFDEAFHRQILAQADLQCLCKRCPTHLSVGQQQRTVLAACLAMQPRLLILDEPTLGQDWAHLQRLMDFVQRLNQSGTTILLISHDYKLVYRYADRVLLLREGRITLDGHPVPQPATHRTRERES